jgi:hypothetical protein
LRRREPWRYWTGLFEVVHEERPPLREEDGRSHFLGEEVRACCRRLEVLGEVGWKI